MPANKPALSPSILAALGLVGSLEACIGPCLDFPDTDTVEETDIDTDLLGPCLDFAPTDSEVDTEPDTDPDTEIGPCLDVAPETDSEVETDTQIGPCLDIAPQDTGDTDSPIGPCLSPPLDTDVEPPDTDSPLGPCLSILPPGETADTFESVEPDTDSPIGPCLDFALPDSGGPELDTGPLPPAPAPRVGQPHGPTAPPLRQATIRKLLNLGALPDDVSDRLRDLLGDDE